MRRQKILLRMAVVAAVSMSVSPAVNAQENGNRDENGKIVRGPYLTNRFCDNWFIGVAGGVNTFWTEGYRPLVGGSLDAVVGKWFTPSIGMRVGYQGLVSNFQSPEPSVLGMEIYSEDGFRKQKFGYMYFHGDFLWNASDGIGGYRQTRFWNLIPYTHAGFFRSYGLNGADFASNEIAAGIGLLHNLRLCDWSDMFIDMRVTFVNGRVCGADGGVGVLPSVTLGFTINPGGDGFWRYRTCLSGECDCYVDQIAALESTAMALEAANASLSAENRSLASSNRKMNRIIESGESTHPHGPIVMVEDMDPIAVFFEIGKTELSKKEIRHLEYVAKNIIGNMDSDIPVCLTVVGTADGNTGSRKRNDYLCRERAKYVYDYLVQKCGVPSERLIVQSGVVGKVAQPEFSRAVLLSF